MESEHALDLFHFYPLQNSFVFITLDQLHLVPSHASRQMFTLLFHSLCYLLSSTRRFSSSCDICSRLSQNSLSSHKQHVHRKKTLQALSRAFLFLSRMPQLSQPVHFLARSLSPDNVMNENVFYVTLHNIIVFNKRISLSLHLIVERNS